MSTAAQTRAAGWYWVNDGGEWIVAKWDGKRWAVTGPQYPRLFAEIDERRIERLPEMPVHKETQG